MWHEKLGVGLRGGEVSPYNARGYEQSAQAKALRCTKAKGAWRGAFCFGQCYFRFGLTGAEGDVDVL